MFKTAFLILLKSIKKILIYIFLSTALLCVAAQPPIGVRLDIGVFCSCDWGQLSLALWCGGAIIRKEASSCPVLSVSCVSSPIRQLTLSTLFLRPLIDCITWANRWIDGPAPVLLHLPHTVLILILIPSRTLSSLQNDLSLIEFQAG